MKKAFLFAYAAKNLGDDLFIKTICTRYPGTLFCLWGDPDQLGYIKQFENIKIYNDKVRWLKKIKKLIPSATARYRDYLESKCKAVVYIGGSIFIEYDNWRDISNWWEYEALKDKFYVLGANFGPYKSEEYRQRMSDIFLKMKDVCFRDRYSKELFKDNDVVRFAPDILTGYPVPSVPVIKKQAFFSVINCSSKDEGENKLANFDENYTSQMASFINELTDQGWNIILSSFCKDEGDEEGNKKVLEKVHDRGQVTEVNYDGYNADEVLTALAGSECIFASRFHATIFALTARRPVIPIIYSDKTINVLDDLGFKGNYLDIRKLSVPVSAQELFLNPEKQLIRNIEEKARESELQFEKLDLVLKP